VLTTLDTQKEKGGRLQGRPETLLHRFQGHRTTL
jgi:hypothetical protein